MVFLIKLCDQISIWNNYDMSWCRRYLWIKGMFLIFLVEHRVLLQNIVQEKDKNRLNLHSKKGSLSVVLLFNLNKFSKFFI